MYLSAYLDDKVYITELNRSSLTLTPELLLSVRDPFLVLHKQHPDLF